MGGLGPKNVKNMATLRMCLFLERERDLWPRGQSGAALGACLGGLGPLLEPVLAVLGRSWVLCWRSWAALGAYVGGLGLLLGLCGRSWCLSWRSWAALGAYVGGLGPLLGCMLALLGGLGLLEGPMGTVLEPKRSLLGRKVAQPEREQAVWRRGRRASVFPLFSVAGPPCRFFSVDISTHSKT